MLNTKNVINLKNVKNLKDDVIVEGIVNSEVLRNKSDERYGDIFEKYLLRNVPFVIPVNVQDWSCMKEWTLNGKPNFDHLKTKFGSAVVPVANCDIRYYNAQEKNNMQLSDYLEYWREYIKSNYIDQMKCLYLKDWHFVRDFPKENIYIVPKYFSSDWLNEYYTSKDNGGILDDYRFVYMGPKGTWTPFHADVFSSFSWSANICGKKRWRLFPPGEENHFKDKFGNLMYDIESDALRDYNLYPNYNRSSVKCYEIIQEQGEAIFVPSGWHHQVWNLEDTISINHNWINGCNIKVMWTSLQQNLLSVKKEISDCKNMDNWIDHCQIMLKASFGIHYFEFYNFLKFIAERRINIVNNNERLVVFGGWVVGREHAIFDLIKINEILCDFVINDDITSLSCFQNEIIYIKSLTDKISSIVTITC